MKIFLLIILLALVFAFVAFIISYIMKKSPNKYDHVQYGFFHHNGNLDFYVSKDGEFVSNTANRSFPLADIEKVAACADEQIVFQKSKNETNQFDDKIEKIFQKHVKHVTYQFEFKNGETFESVVDVATNKGGKQRLELKSSLDKLTSLLNRIEFS